MQKTLRFIFTIMLLIAVSMTVQAQTYDVLDLRTGERHTSESVPHADRTITTDGESIFITYTINEIGVRQSSIYPGAEEFYLQGFGLETGAGNPGTISRLERFSIGSNTSANLTIESVDYHTINTQLIPATIPVTESSSAILNQIDVTGEYPISNITAEAVKTYRQSYVLQYVLNPMQYDNSTGTLKICKELSVRISLADMSIPNQLTEYDVTESPFDDLIALAYNQYNSDFQCTDTGAQPYAMIDIPETSLNMNHPYSSKYLIITPSSLNTKTLKNFAHWKTLLGSESSIIEKASWTTDDVASAILNFYAQNPDLEYVLLIGDYDNIPCYYSNSTLLSHTDLPYYRRSNDAVPFVYGGRIPVSSTDELDVVLNKILFYMLTPTDSEVFYNQALHAAYFEDNNKDSVEDKRFVKTSEDICDLVSSKSTTTINRVYYANASVTPLQWNDSILCNGEFIPNHLHKSEGFSWSGKTADVINAYNHGCHYVLYRGHGSSTRWLNIPFNQKSIAECNNCQTQPIFFNLTCSTGGIHNKDNLTKHLLTIPNKGAASVIASTEESYSGANDIFGFAMFDLMYPYSKMIPNFGISGIYTPTKGHRFGEYQLGKIFELGLQKVEESNNKFAKYIRYSMHIFGDPSLGIRNSLPKNGTDLLTIKSDNSVEFTGNKTILTVYNSLTEETKMYRDGGFVPIDDIAHSTICLSGHNILPYVFTGDYSADAPSKFISYEYVNRFQIRLRYNFNIDASEKLIVYTTLFPNTGIPKAYQATDNEFIMNINTSATEHLIQLVADGKVVDAIRFRTTN